MASLSIDMNFPRLIFIHYLRYRLHFDTKCSMGLPKWYVEASTVNPSKTLTQNSSEAIFFVLHHLAKFSLSKKSYFMITTLMFDLFSVFNFSLFFFQFHSIKHIRFLIFCSFVCLFFIHFCQLFCLFFRLSHLMALLFYFRNTVAIWRRILGRNFRMRLAVLAINFPKIEERLKQIESIK